MKEPYQGQYGINPYPYQGIDPSYWAQNQPAVQYQPALNINAELARIAQALEGIETELRSRRAQQSSS
jgi:hypothetical protein